MNSWVPNIAATQIVRLILSLKKLPHRVLWVPNERILHNVINSGENMG
jgi:hypothetical protein